MRMRSSQDFAAGLLLLGFGLAGLWIGADYPMGTPQRPGTGVLPHILSWCLIAFAAVIGLRSLAIEGEPIGSIHIRSNALILISIFLFAGFLDVVGLAATVFAVCLVAAFTTREAKLKEAVVLALGLAVFCVAVFIYALNQPLQAFGCR